MPQEEGHHLPSVFRESSSAPGSLEDYRCIFLPLNLAFEQMIWEVFNRSNGLTIYLKVNLTTFYYPVDLLDTLYPSFCISECKFKKSGNWRHLAACTLLCK